MWLRKKKQKSSKFEHYVTGSMILSGIIFNTHEYDEQVTLASIKYGSTTNGLP